jgi:hypothetical protein
MPWDTAIAAFAITAAILLVGGAILLRYQRDRYHFLLMQAALTHGITSFPGTPPGWLVSLRVGVMALVLGLGLMGAGAALHRSAEHVEAIPANVRAGMNPGPGMNGPGNPERGVPAGMMDPNGPPPGPNGPPFRGGPNGPGPNGPGPNGPGPNGPGQGLNGPPNGPNNPNFNALPRPAPNPALERWHRVQNYRTTGLLTGCAGAILAALGVVRIFFSRLERRYDTEPAGAVAATAVPPAGT